MPESQRRTPFPLLAEALRRRVVKINEEADHLEAMGNRIGLTPAVIVRSVAEIREDAYFLGEIFEIIAGLAPVEHTIRAVLDIQPRR